MAGGGDDHKWVIEGSGCQGGEGDPIVLPRSKAHRARTYTMVAAGIANWRRIGSLGDRLFGVAHLWRNGRNRIMHARNRGLYFTVALEQQ